MPSAVVTVIERLAVGSLNISISATIDIRAAVRSGVVEDRRGLVRSGIISVILIGSDLRHLIIMVALIQLA